MNLLMPHPQQAAEKKSTPITAVIAGLAPAVISSQGAGRSLICKAFFLIFQPRDLREASFNKHTRIFLRSKSILPLARPNTRTGLKLHQRELTVLAALLRKRRNCVCVCACAVFSQFPFYMLTTGFEKWLGITTVMQVSND